MDYQPGHHRQEDITLSKGDIVQLVSADSGWMFVQLMKDDFDKKGWVPDTYLERKLDVDISSIAGLYFLFLCIPVYMLSVVNSPINGYHRRLRLMSAN